MASLLLFRLGSRVLALPAHVARQARPLESLTSVPGSRGALLGLTPSAGKALPVLDLRSLIGLPAGELPPLTLHLNMDGQELALPTDDVIGFIEDDQLPGNELMSEELLLGSYSDGYRGHLLNPQLLMTAVSQRLRSV